MRYRVTDQQYMGSARGAVVEADPADPRVAAAVAQRRLEPMAEEPPAEPEAAPKPTRRKSRG